MYLVFNERGKRERPKKRQNKKKEKKSRTFVDAHEAMDTIAEYKIWESVVAAMDDDVREQVHAELAPCSEEAFLARYLELAREDLVIG